MSCSLRVGEGDIECAEERLGGHGGSSLKERVLAYQKTRQGLDSILAELSERIYRYPSRRRRSSEDDAGEFYLYFLPRLKRLLVNFKDQGVPFEHYLNATLFWNLKSYFRSEKKKKKLWQASTSPDFWELSEVAATSDPGFVVDWSFILSQVWNGTEMDATSRKRLLFLFLRHVREIDESEIELFSRKTAYDCDWLSQRIRHLRETLQMREDRLQRLKKRRNQAFSCCLLRERELKGETDADRREKLDRQIRRLRRILRKTEFEISRVPLSPSHSSIARELGVPKGTVDTGIYWINRKLKTLYAERMIEYSQGYGFATGHEQHGQVEGVSENL